VAIVEVNSDIHNTMSNEVTTKRPLVTDEPDSKKARTENETEKEDVSDPFKGRGQQTGANISSAPEPS